MGRAVLLSIEEADEVSKEPREKIRQQLDYRKELDQSLSFRQAAVQVVLEYLSHFLIGCRAFLQVKCSYST